MKIVKIPSNYGALDKAEGVELAPDIIVKELKDIWLNEEFKVIDFNVEEVKELEKINDGDIFLGGDNSITYYAFKSFAKRFNNPGLILLDAHPDLYSYFDFPSHADWLLFLINENIVKKENVIIAGIRNPDKKEIEFLRENKIKFFMAKDMFNKLDYVIDNMMEMSRNFDGLYLAIDIDVVDPAFAPGTGYIEPGGLSSRELLYILQRLKKLKNLKAFDITEVNPKKDFNNMTSKLAARLIMELV